MNRRLTKSIKRVLAVQIAFLGLVLVIQAAMAHRRLEEGHDRQEAGKPARTVSPITPQLTKQAKVLQTLDGHDVGVLSVAFAPDGKTLRSAGADAVRLWDLVLTKEQVIHKLGACSGSVAFSPDGRIFASALESSARPNDFTVMLRDVTTGQERAVLDGHADIVLAEAFSPDGKLLASGSRDTTVKLWEVATAKLKATLPHTDWVQAVAFSMDGKLLASASSDKTVILWDVATGEYRATLQGHRLPVMSMSFSPDARTLATASEDETIILWELATKKVRATLKGHTDDVTMVTYHPSGTMLASAGRDKTIRVWDLKTGNEHATLRGHTDCVNAVAYSGDGLMLVSGSEDRSIKLWKILSPVQREEAIGLHPEALLKLWTSLAGEDAQNAYDASNTLVRSPLHTITLIKDRLRPVVESNQREASRLVADLDSDQFALRQKAAQALEQLGGRIEQPLRKKLGDKPSYEVQRRIEELLTLIDQQQIQEVRAVEVLERIGTADARKVLEALSAGAEGARLTREARAALHLNRTSN